VSTFLACAGAKYDDAFSATAVYGSKYPDLQEYLPLSGILFNFMISQ